MAKDQYFDENRNELTRDEYESRVAQMDELDKMWTLTDEIKGDHIVHYIDYI